MSRGLGWIIAVSAAAVAAGSAPLASAFTASSPDRRGLSKGDLVVTFSGSGGGGYRFHQPAVGGSGSACRVADATYSEADSYRWSYRFVLPPGGGSSDTPSTLAAGGQLSGTEQLVECAGATAVTSTCTQALRAPLADNPADLGYPEVTVGAAGRFVTVGAVGELIRSTPPDCTGFAVVVGNLVEGFPRLQASVGFPSALLASTGDAVRRFTMAGSGRYRGVMLSGDCDSASCAIGTCTDGSGGGGVGAPSACSFSESYSGTIEVRVVK
ncbi:MAG TPA: hypothetical protein VNC12_02950 [Solirubrobacteraceae bacterium]|nr:hypothetical protein [Solirubrobacteraceae bacterium]